MRWPADVLSEKGTTMSDGRRRVGRTLIGRGALLATVLLVAGCASGSPAAPGPGETTPTPRASVDAAATPTPPASLDVWPGGPAPYGPRIGVGFQDDLLVFTISGTGTGGFCDLVPIAVRQRPANVEVDLVWPLPPDSDPDAGNCVMPGRLWTMAVRIDRARVGVDQGDVSVLIQDVGEIAQARDTYRYTVHRDGTFEMSTAPEN
jgi:hypothetical protein